MTSDEMIKAIAEIIWMNTLDTDKNESFIIANMIAEMLEINELLR